MVASSPKSRPGVTNGLECACAHTRARTLRERRCVFRPFAVLSAKKRNLMDLRGNYDTLTLLTRFIKSNAEWVTRFLASFLEISTKSGSFARPALQLNSTLRRMVLREIPTTKTLDRCCQSMTNQWPIPISWHNPCNIHSSHSDLKQTSHLWHHRSVHMSVASFVSSSRTIPTATSEKPRETVLSKEPIPNSQRLSEKHHTLTGAEVQKWEWSPRVAHLRAFEPPRIMSSSESEVCEISRSEGASGRLIRQGDRGSRVRERVERAPREGRKEGVADRGDRLSRISCESGVAPCAAALTRCQLPEPCATVRTA